MQLLAEKAETGAITGPVTSLGPPHPLQLSPEGFGENNAAGSSLFAFLPGHAGASFGDEPLLEGFLSLC